MIPRRQSVREDNVDSWLMSYADMITLLLCFFIIFVSVSEPRKEKISAITNGMAGKFGTVDLSTPFEGTFKTLEAVVENHQLLRDVAITKSDKTIEMELSTDSFFQPESADFAQDKLPALSEMIQALRQIDFLDYHITVEGHTSDVPINTALYPSNWELSSARASRIVRLFIERGIKPEYLKAVGYADTRPTVPNRDSNGNAIIENRKKNERIVITLERLS